MVPALFDAFPTLTEPQPARGYAQLPYLSLGQFPTPIERVLAPLQGGCELWVKREDLSGALYGGNKVRRLEFLLAEVPPAGESLATFGGYGSNHVLATGIYGKKLGCRVQAVLYPQPLVPAVRAALRADLAVELKLRLCRTYFGVPWELARLSRQRPAPRLISPGGVDPVGVLGWWSGGLEIAAQVAAGLAPRFDAVYVALGAGDTTAGLLLGLGMAATEVVAVRVVPWPVASSLGVRLLARRTRALLIRRYGQAKTAGPRPKLRVEGRFLGRGYGHPTPWGAQAIQRGADLGLILDPTYTGKAFSALLADVDSGRLAGKRVLFVHTYNSRDLSSLISAGDLGMLPHWLRSRLADNEPAPR
jgi:1-aminocyclopropane-1-carboxylate deaminase/D-cysteine desulfhydrase-like pyridoxal-dependent ACC family enzyme